MEPKPAQFGQEFPTTRITPQRNGAGFEGKSAARSVEFQEVADQDARWWEEEWFKQWELMARTQH